MPTKERQREKGKSFSNLNQKCLAHRAGHGKAQKYPHKLFIKIPQIPFVVVVVVVAIVAVVAYQHRPKQKKCMASERRKKKIERAKERSGMRWKKG